MSRLRYNGLATGSAGSLVALSLGGSLTSSATSVTFNAALTYQNGTAVPTIASPDILPLSLLDSTGSFVTEVVYLTAYTSAGTTGTIARGQEGFTGVAHASGDKIVHAATVSDVGGILAQKIYNPGTITTYTITATTITDVDSTNLAVTFTAPMSGNVLVTLQGLHQIPNGAASAYTSLYWGLRESTTTLHEKAVFGGAFLSSAAWDTASCMRYVITGVSAGSHTYKWAHRLDAASKTATLYAGGAAGQTVMTVETLP